MHSKHIVNLKEEEGSNADLWRTTLTKGIVAQIGSIRNLQEYSRPLAVYSPGCESLILQKSKSAYLRYYNNDNSK